MTNHTGLEHKHLYMIRDHKTGKVSLAQFNDYDGNCDDYDFCTCHFAFFGTDYTYRYPDCEVLYRVVTVRV